MRIWVVQWIPDDLSLSIAKGNTLKLRLLRWLVWLLVWVLVWVSIWVLLLLLLPLLPLVADIGPFFTKGTLGLIFEGIQLLLGEMVAIFFHLSGRGVD